MKVAIVFDPLPELGPDPLDDAQMPRRLGEFFDTADGVDLILFYREYGDQFEGGSRTHVYQSGAWENVPSKRISKMLKRLGEL